MQFDWLMRVHYNAVIHCGLWHYLGLSVFSPLHLCFGAKIQNYKQNHKALKIQSRSRKQEGMDQRNKAILSVVLPV